MIEHYLAFWEQAEEKKLQEIDKQRESLNTELKEVNGGSDSSKGGSKKGSKPSNKKQ